MCFFFGSVGLEHSSGAAVSEAAGHQAAGGDVVTAAEVRGQVQRALVLLREVQRDEQGDGGGQNAAARRAT